MEYIAYFCTIIEKASRGYPDRCLIKLSREERESETSKQKPDIRKYKSTPVEANDQAKLTTQSKEPKRRMLMQNPTK